MLDNKLINPNTPRDIAHNLVSLQIEFLGFDKERRIGQIIVNKVVQKDVADFFAKALELEFPIEKVIPASEYNFDDNLMMSDNNSSGFNYRNIAGTEQLSAHSKGLAFDINTRLNPYIRYTTSGVITKPKGAVWDKNIEGTLYDEHPLVLIMKSKGWIWGGDWTPDTGRVDYQHFEKEM